VDKLRRDEPHDQGNRYESKVAPTAADACGVRTATAIDGLRDRKVGRSGIRGRYSHRIA
jgi:hypothetical protein